ncbi:hypothetical protein PENSTE_c006G08299 [Penicillium steckii]|uniref:Uncharacterized protein n=1 Tax=Penicillium steckii TaxID=303698 RepID=A0A1V6TGP5_9EURO|nr:hypothetical protein PENSTE_c006G08299 [Penicillium steckii]
MKSFIITALLASLALAMPQMNQGLEKRACDCEGYKKCTPGCAAFGGTPGGAAAEAACIMSCAKINDCWDSAC